MAEHGATLETTAARPRATGGPRLALSLALGMSVVGCNDAGEDGGVWSGTGTTTAATTEGVTSVGLDSSGGATGTGTTAGSSSDGADSTTGGPIFDVGGGKNLCGCEGSYIWIANAEAGTVSKINTQTLVEEGRYQTRPDGGGSPSRTSVSWAGDVAVANRFGGLVKFHADPANCVESNGMPGIQTSTGPGDVLSWDMEECRHWYSDFPTSNQRPVAWAPPQNPEEFDCDDPAPQRVWTVGSSVISLPGTGGFGGVTAWLVDGDDGSILETVDVPDFMGSQLGAYGGAVDRDGNLYFSTQGALTFGNNQLARVEIDTLAVTIWMVPPSIAPYGITVDHNGRVWLSSMLGDSAVRFDPETETWDIVDGSFTSQAGLMEHPSGNMWIGTDVGAIEVDVETLMLGDVFVPVGGGLVKGISVDSDGFVWAVNDIAHKFDPATGGVVGTYTGLSGPYTYSDMTGWALQNATCTPEG